MILTDHLQVLKCSLTVHFWREFGAAAARGGGASMDTENSSDPWGGPRSSLPALHGLYASWPHLKSKQYTSKILCFLDNNIHDDDRKELTVVSCNVVVTVDLNILCAFISLYFFIVLVLGMLCSSVTCGTCLQDYLFMINLSCWVSMKDSMKYCTCVALLKPIWLLISYFVWCTLNPVMKYFYFNIFLL